MLVNATHFCGLSSSKQFLAWLFSFNRAIHDNLVEFLHKPSGCAANSSKMAWVFDEISRCPNGLQSLELFLKQSYPYIITEYTQPSRSSIVFDHYDPSLLTIPRRRIFDSEDEARAFVVDKPVAELVVVDGRSYVEYLTDDMLELVDQIPDSNWQVRKWRQS